MDLSSESVSNGPVSTVRTRTSLIRAVSGQDGGTRWEEFDRTYRGIVLGMARKHGLAHHDAEDVTQDVFKDLARTLGGFQKGNRRGSFRRYLSNLVRWRVSNARETLKRRDAEEMDAPDGDDGPSLMEKISAPPDFKPFHESDFRNAVTQAMMVLARDLKPKDIQILELYFCQEWSAKRIAKALGTTSTNVFVVAHRHRLKLCSEIIRRL